eukprot:11579549-Ditylum_brightwellii.AAC.1
MSPGSIICIDDSDDNEAGRPQPSVVASDPVQNWQERIADIVEDKTKNYLATIFWQMQANNPSPDMGNMFSQLLSQMQMTENTAEKKKTAIKETGDKKKPEKCE